MTDPKAEPALTPYEKALIADPGGERGYTPDDQIQEPSQGPSEPASASRSGAHGEYTPPSSESTSMNDQDPTCT